MNEQEPFYKNARVILFIAVILGSLIVIMPSYSDGKFDTNLKYGLDLEGGSWLQLQLQGVVAQVDADEGKIIQADFGRLLNDPAIRLDEVAEGSVTFTTSKDTDKKTIDAMGYGISTVSKGADGGTRITLQTSKEYLIKKYLENNLNAEVIPITGRFITVEIRKAMTQEELEDSLNQVGGKVIPPFRVGVSAETLELTKKILEDKLNTAGFKEIPIRTVGDNYIMVDLAGMDMTTAREIAAKPGKFEIRIQVQGNETVHVLYGTDIRNVDPIQKESVRVPGSSEKAETWGVPFELSDEGAQALRDAAIQYGAVTNPEAHYLSMYLDDKLVFDAALARDLAKNIKSVPVKNLVANTGQGAEGERKARELHIHLSAGALPVNVEVIGSGQVSAELGEKFKEQVVFAGIIALIIVAFTIYFRYRQPNIIIPMLATSFSEVLIILGFTAVVGFQLDLPTITGIIAVIGTGIDHLIIITDEVLAGGSMPPDKVYKSRLTKAFAIIMAAAATVIIAMSPLLIMGFGALRGFAIITIVGVLIGVGIARPAYALIIQGLLVETSDKKFADED
ncbi:MAG: preprotein translocase subunit SecD [Euryarchaeota archaeon]|nr:preprotein translocase subunit SecD [Euryarchaeota archaeon]MBU4340734.1 preprotein translocase subunit SecD [Euryarchaeota archaeon]MBU4454347.1 preprotein translocase subunit SecD [Euryarchaeota archaeon]MCG2737450.1 preprotein translocase subunit SecD [Candidatus Methanoperedenaceae archaeon]